jgi:phage terminase small subunit
MPRQAQAVAVAESITAMMPAAVGGQVQQAATAHQERLPLVEQAGPRKPEPMVPAASAAAAALHPLGQVVMGLVPRAEQELMVQEVHQAARQAIHQEPVQA